MRTGLVTREPHRVAANPARVITRLFVPARRASSFRSPERERCSSRILALTDDDVRSVPG